MRGRCSNATTHAYGYDPLGRLVSDDVLAFGTGVETSVGMVGYGYDDAGRLFKATRYTDDVSVAKNGEEERLNDGFGNLVTDYRATSHVNNASSPKVR